ncbi:FAD-binding protein [uncultured Kordia sp.]|uniref:FAD-binding protein n=1 Tax=uncultured Kordia sp. TaxID=507699 RepID=UPI00261450A1|nr:FAD-binding protein [uncultured Kordia sp.]
MNHSYNFSGIENKTDKELSNNNFQNSNFTLQCWIQTETAGEILSKYTTETTFSLQVNEKGNIEFSVNTKENARTITATNVSVTDNEWYHITAIKTDTFLYLYINEFNLIIENSTKKLVITNETDTFRVGGTSKASFFTGNISQVAIWNKALLENEVTFITKQEDISGIEGLIKTVSLIKDELDSISPNNFDLSVTIKVRNTSFETLHLRDPANYSNDVPKTIAVNEEEVIFLTSGIFSVINREFIYENKSGSTTIVIHKNLNKFNTVITALSEKDLVNDLAIKENETLFAKAELVIGENNVVVNMRNVYNFLNGLRGHLNCDQIQTPGGNLIDQIEYNKASQVFNRRFQKKPFAIIFCESTEDVQRVYKDAIANNLPIRVRSGGHDHEAECTGTNVILLDMTRINHVEVSHNKKYARIGPGIRFKDLTPQLAFNDVMIPHGTCATVGVAGFTFGGGWGPWTRKHGMNCEGLVGATVVLGNGDVVKLQAENSDKKDLLWALKGGGGMSYGIVTELQLKVFPLPKKLIKFELEWNPYEKNNPCVLTGDKCTKEILQAWENVIMNKVKASSTDGFTNDQLIGTNLKISGKHLQGDPKCFKPALEIHNCIMYGYWDGSEESLIAFVKTSYANVLPEELRIIGKGGQRLDYADDGLMSEWDRVSYSAISRSIRLEEFDTMKANNVTTKVREETYDRIYKIATTVANNSEMDMVSNQFQLSSTKKPLPPDLDAPAPHKITSRLADKDGLGDIGANQLISSLTSKLILDDNRKLGLFTYITLGAISGEFYDTMSETAKNRSAFPYKNNSYTIQYQTWWNTELLQKEQEQNNDVYNRTNRALDWMQVCRDYEIENSGGSFISFKDASIPTKTYFGDNYDDLIQVKKSYSKDPLNHFRTRKTII